MKKILYISLALAAAVPALNSCRDADLDPTLAQDKDLESGINSADDLQTVLNSAYDRMSHYTYYGRDFIIFGEVRSDNTYANGNSNRFPNVNAFNMISTDAYASDTWTRMYKVVQSANTVIGKDESQLTGDKDLAKNVKGQAYAVRALAHFDLLRLFGQYDAKNHDMSALGIPYVTSTEIAFPSRASVQENYNSIIEDLDTAISLLDESINTSDLSDAHFFNVYGAEAIKARVALYFQQYETAKTAAKAVIDSKNYSVISASGFASTFKSDSTPNQIFSIANSASDNQGNNSLQSIYNGDAYGDIVPVAALPGIYDKNDVRKSIITDDKGEGSIDGELRNVGKYPSISGADDTPVIRYEEVVLTYAEALLKTGDASTALTYLNSIPANRDESAYSTATLDNILLERRKEFAFEGIRFWDLARTGQAVPVINSVGSTTGTIAFPSYKYAFPIPNSEIQVNSNIVQNEGY
ncbi:RagB/SusD family nutrient uptake outer membrane protein [Daejeonia sp. YH14]|uniref:RagB/SusD family nutrient uptake outer membrane protein n=1 Tax=Daejeonia sp. YH14 TaxID=3439042 RepID=UPI003F499CC7